MTRLEQIRDRVTKGYANPHRWEYSWPVSAEAQAESDVGWLLDEVDRLREGSHRILWNRRPDGDCGSIDEVVFRRPETVHIEQMHETCWWIGIYLDGTDRYWTGNFTAKTSRSGLDFSEQEDAGVGWDRDDCHAEWEPEDA